MLMEDIQLNSFRHSILAAALCALASLGAMAPAHADSTIPVADFFKKAQFGGARLAPNGQHLAVLIPRNGRFVLAVIDVATRNSKVVASDPDWNIANPQWVNSERLTFSITKGSDDVAANNAGGGLFAVNRDGSAFRKLVATVKEQGESGARRYLDLAIIKRVGGDSNELFVANNERGLDADFGATDVFRLDTTTGRKTLLTFDNPGNVNNWVLDHANVIRVASGLTVDPANKRIRQSVHYRAGADAPWQKIHQGYIDEGADMDPLGFDFDNQTLFVAGRFQGRDKVGVHAWDFAANTAGELIAEHAEADIGGQPLLFDEERKKLVGVFFNAMKPEKYYFDEDYARLQATLDASFPGQRVDFQWRGERVLVQAGQDANPGKLYFYDMKKKVIEPLYSLKPEFDNKKLSVQQVVKYTARDGMTIPAYLTLPEGQAPKALPLVAYIHGGPHARDQYGFDGTVQMLASRGYAVLQPQFRMSTGFGWKHHAAGWKQWGLAMQDDVTDGIRDLVKQGVVDPKRVCIMGGSYGGYATMYGLIKDPDLYQCGINIVGVTDVKLLFTVAWSDTRGPLMDSLGKKMHGDPATDEAYFRKVSAIDNAAAIKKPVMMAYGSEDIRVPLIHGERMRDKLKAQGTPVEWIVMTGEGHGWAKESNNILFGQKVLDFMDKHIGPKAAGQ